MFEGVTIRPADHPIAAIPDYDSSAEQVADGIYWVEPSLGEDAIVLRQESYSGEAMQHDARALVRQVPLHLEDRALLAGRGVPEYPATAAKGLTDCAVGELLTLLNGI